MKKPIIKDIHLGGNWLSFYYEGDPDIAFGTDFTAFWIEICDMYTQDPVYTVTTSNIYENHFVMLENDFSLLTVGNSYEIYTRYKFDNQISDSSDAYVLQYQEKMDYLTGLDAPEITQLHMIQFGNSIEIPYNSPSDKITFDSFKVIISDNDTVIFNEITTNFDSSTNIVTLEFPFNSDGIIINNIFKIGNTYSIKLCYANSNTNTYSNISEAMNLLYSPNYIVNPPYLSQNPQYSTGNTLSISYRMNVYVNTDDFNSFNIKILTEKDEEILNVTTSNFDSETITLEFPYISENGEKLENPLKSGTYNLSIAYVGEHGIGNFSNTIILEYTGTLDTRPPLILSGNIVYYYGDIIEIPYKMNSLVSYRDFNSFNVKISSVSDNSLIFEGKTSNFNSNKIILEFPYIQTNGTKLDNPLVIDSIYNIQIAYVNNTIVGAYSDQATFQYIKKPTNLLYPPMLQGTIPACCENTITIPYIMNKAVSYYDFEDFKIIISSIKNNITVFRGNSSKFDKNTNIISLIFSGDKVNPLVVGEFYRIQIAYHNKLYTSPYSTIAIMKYTDKPEVTISNLQSGTGVNNNHKYSYYGKFQQKKDLSEKMYSYKFIIYNEKGKIYKQTEDILYNNSLDTSDSSAIAIVRYDFNEDIPEGIVYKIQFLATTINGLVVSSEQYNIKKLMVLPNPDGILVIPYFNYNNGSIALSLSVRKTEPSTSVNLDILRSDDSSNFKSWEKILQLDNISRSTNISKVILRDYSVKSGFTYKYAFRQREEKNNSIKYSNRIESSKEISVDFEDMFLSDGEKQLRIRFNPNVSSFKTTIQESKIDTIGSKYPYFFRNDIIGYKEFPINGLISLQMDEDKYFSDEIKYYKEINRDENGNQIQDLEYGLNKETFKNELSFKTKVLDWLNNGKPKIFRSNAEGNYIVRLMNVSLSPLSNSINRLVHSFSCTAYEIAEFNTENLIENNLLQRY